ncbi:MAG TPA: glycerol-3-phosphate responsive antiterminator [Thermotogota bacterium]|nr:glycerol-3-phosphate responsive antiterminator [Thermotogota bacterium]HRW91469.1 glycerol-3-phosphate responsive antiterminator [Thermotogota bacterium]
MSFHPVIAAIWDPRAIAPSLEQSVCSHVFLLRSDIVGLQGQLKQIRRAGKKVFVDVDFVDGLGSDEYALRYVHLSGADGIITVRSRMVEFAKKVAFPVVLRSFALDSSALERMAETIRGCSPDFLEILPGLALGKARQFLLERELLLPPLIAAGLVDTREEMDTLLSQGAIAVSTSCQDLWKPWP